VKTNLSSIGFTNLSSVGFTNLSCVGFTNLSSAGFKNFTLPMYYPSHLILVQPDFHGGNEQTELYKLSTEEESKWSLENI
jgi:hypothetical protein